MNSSFPRGEYIDNGLKRVPEENHTVTSKRARRTLVDKMVDVNSKNESSCPIEISDFSDSLTISNLKTGSLVLGFVLQIIKSDVLVSLPGGFTGVVSYPEISDVIFKLANDWSHGDTPKNHLPTTESILQPFQMVRCFILGQLDKKDSQKKIISLSMRSSLINKGIAMKHFGPGFPISGCISSKEDHGWIISVGIPGVNCFLPNKHSPNKPLLIGQPIECVCANVDEISRSLTLRTNSKVVSQALTSGSLLTFKSLSPGMLVSVIIDSKYKNGLVVNFLGLFTGIIDNSSLDLEDKGLMAVGDVLPARIVLLENGSKIVRLSVKRHVIDIRTPSDLPPLGSVMENVEVFSVVNKSGILLSRDAGQMAANKIPIFIHKTSLASINGNTCTDFNEICKRYQQGMKINSVRVKGYNLVEGWIVGSNMEEYIHDSVIHISDVKIGQVLDVVIFAIKDFGLVVKIGSLLHGISAVCPLLHSADVVVGDTKLNKKFKVGQICKMRVWEVFGTSVIMTNKKSIIDADSKSILQNIDDVKVGKPVIGIISKISEINGITVHFFNKMKGLILSTVLIEQKVYNFSTAFRVGQVVNTVIIGMSGKKSGKKEENLIYLGLDLNICSDAIVALNKKLNFESNVLFDHVHVSSHEFVDGVVSGVENDNVYVTLKDGRFAKSSKHHFFDFKASAENAFSTTYNKISVGHIIKGALIISNVNGLFISSKPLLIKVASLDDKAAMFPSKIADLSPGQIVVGFIHKVEDYGVLVRFRDNLTALAPRPNISDKFICSPVGRFSVGDSVRCVVQRVDLVKERIIVTFKSSIVPPSSGNLNFLAAQFKENHYSSDKFREINRDEYQLGTIVSALISSIEEFGIVVVVPNKTSFIVVKNIGDSNNMKIGSSVDVLIVDLDYEHSVYDGVLSLCSTNTDLNISKYDGKIVLVKDNYLVVLSSASDLLGYVNIGDYHNPKPDMSSYKVGDVVKLKVLHQSQQYPKYPHERYPVFSIIHDTDNNKSTVFDYHSITSNASGEQKNKAFFESLSIGSMNRWTILAVNSLDISLKPETDEVLTLKVVGNLHISNCFDFSVGFDNCKELVDNDSSSNTKNHPFYNLQIGDSVWCYVQHAIKRKSGLHEEIFVTLSLAKPCNFDTVFLPFGEMFSLRHDRPKLAIGVVTKIGDISCTISLSPHITALLNFMDVSCDDEMIRRFKRNCFVGLRVVVKVTNLSQEGKIKLRATRFEIEKYLSPDLNLLKDENIDNILHGIDQSDMLFVGQTVTGLINLNTSKVPKYPAIMIGLRGSRFGRVCVTEICDKEDWCDLTQLFNGNSLRLPNGCSHGDLVSCVVLSVDERFVELSLRKSRLAANSFKPDQISQDCPLVKGFVVHTSSKGCFLRLSQLLTGQVLMKDISDDFVSNPEAQFPTGMLVSARLLSLNPTTSQARLTMKQSNLQGFGLNNVVLVPTTGDVVPGTVSQVTDFGVFVLLNDFKVVGLDRNQNLKNKVKVGDVVSATVLSVSNDGAKIGLDLCGHSLIQQSNYTSIVEKETDFQCSYTTKFQVSRIPLLVSKSGDIDHLDSVLLWEDFVAAEKVDYSDCEELAHPSNSSKHGRKNNFDQYISLAESDCQNQQTLQCSDDFERLLIANPNSSVIWTRYMAFHLNSSDLPSSRNIGARALRTINFREEEEKFNVWMALINLEHKFGTMESLETVFNQAVKESKVAEIYLRAGDIEGAENVFKKALNRHQLKKSKKVWTAYLQFKLKFDNESAKGQLTRSLQCLSKHKHIDVISKYALSEFDFGSVDRGRVLFEELLISYPKRSDLWHLFVDKEVKLENIAEARHLFERMISCKTSDRNLKLIFKKYLAFELKHGDESYQESVKQKARDYVNKLLC